MTAERLRARGIDRLVDVRSADREVLRDAVAGMARDNALWLGRKKIGARTVTIKVRYSDFTTITRSHSHEATNDPDEVVQRAVALLEKTEAGRRPVRLLGAGVQNLEPLGENEEADEVDGAQLRFEA